MVRYWRNTGVATPVTTSAPMTATFSLVIMIHLVTVIGMVEAAVRPAAQALPATTAANPVGTPAVEVAASNAARNTHVDLHDIVSKRLAPHLIV